MNTQDIILNNDNPDGIDRRGVTFAHLVREEGRWLILAAAWENEREEAPLPAGLI